MEIHAPKRNWTPLMRICIMLPLISVPENESEISKYEIVLPKSLSRCKRANLNAHKMKTDDNFTKSTGKTYIINHFWSNSSCILYILLFVTKSLTFQATFIPREIELV